MLFVRDYPEISQFRAMDDAALRDVLAIPQAAGDAHAVFDILTTQPAYLQAVLERRFDHSFLKETVRWAIDQFTDQMHPLTLLWMVSHVIEASSHIHRRELAQALVYQGKLMPRAEELPPAQGVENKPGFRYSLAGEWLVLCEPELEPIILAALPPGEHGEHIATAVSTLVDRGQIERALSLALKAKDRYHRYHAFVKVAPALDMETRLPLLREMIADSTQLFDYMRHYFMGRVIGLLPSDEAELSWQAELQKAHSADTVDKQIIQLGQLTAAIFPDSPYAQIALAELWKLIETLPDQTISDDALNVVSFALAVHRHPEAIPYFQKWFEQAVTPANFWERRRMLVGASIHYAREGFVQYAVTCAAYIGGDVFHSEQAYEAIGEAMARLGQVDEAIALADTLDVGVLRPAMLKQIALTLARLDDPRAGEMIETAYESFKAPSDGSALQQIALWLARHHQLDLAYQVIHEPFVRDNLESEFATALHQQNVKLALEANDIQAAILASRSFKLGTMYHVEALEAIATKAATLHGLEAAREVMAESHPETGQRGAWREVGIALVKRGELDDAQQVAAMLRSQNEHKPPSDPFAFWGILMNVVGEATGKVEETNTKFQEMKGQWQESHQRDYEAWETKAFEEYPAAIDRAIVGALTQQDRLREALVITRRLRYPEHRVEAFQAIIAALPTTYAQLNSLLGDMLMDARQISEPAARRKALMQVMILMIEHGRFEQVLSLRSTLDQKELDFAIPVLKALAPELAIGLRLPDEAHQSEPFGELVDELLNKEQLEAVRKIVPSLSGRVHENIERMLRLAREFAERGRWTEAYATLDELAHRDTMYQYHVMSNFLKEIIQWDLPPDTLLESLRIAGWGRLRWRHIHSMIVEAGPLP